MDSDEPAPPSPAVAAGHGPVPRWRVLIAYLAPAVLVAVAVHQLVLSHVYSMTPWKGGGFGMFASTDAAALRFIRGFVIVDGRELPISSPGGDAAERLAPQAVALPSAARLHRLADALATRSWRLGPGADAAAVGSSRDVEGARPIHPSAVRLEVYRLHFHRETLELERSLLAEAVRELP